MEMPSIEDAQQHITTPPPNDASNDHQENTAPDDAINHGYIS